MKTKDYIYQHPWLAKIIAFIIVFPTIFASLWAFFDPLDPFKIKFLEEFGIWGYFGLLIFSFLVSIIYVIFFIKKPQLTLPKIETKLHKDEDLEPKFFRKAGPLWIDFERGFIFRRDEVDEIINELNEESRHVVEGKPASGKSVLLKNIGFDLRKGTYKVFYIDCKFERKEDINNYIKEALKVDDAKTLIIIDNYHLKIDTCDYFLKQYRNQDMRKTKVLIGTRPIIGQSERRDLEIKGLKKTEITPESVSKNIINKYLKVHFQLNDKEIEDYPMIFNEYELDLWHLSWALEAFKLGEEVIDIQTIYKKIKKWIEEIEKEIDYAEDIFLSLSILNRFEIPIEKRFLTNKEYGLGIEKKKIDKLVYQNEIVPIPVTNSKERTALTLHHSSLAWLIYETYQNTKLGENFKDKFEISGDNDFEKGFLLRYLIHSDLLYYIDKILYDIDIGSLVFYSKDDLQTTYPDFKNLLERTINQYLSSHSLRTKIQNTIQYIINGDRDLTEINSYWNLYPIGLPTEFVIELNKELNFEILTRKINESVTTGDITATSRFFDMIQYPFLKRIIVQIDLRSLKSEIMMIDALSGCPYPEESDLYAFARCYGAIAHDNDTIGRDLLEIIKCILQKMDEYMEDYVEPGLSLENIIELIRVVVDEQALYGRNYAVIDNFLKSIKEIIEAKLNEVDLGLLGLDPFDESPEALEEMKGSIEDRIEGFKEEIRNLFEGWSEEFIKRTLARFDIPVAR